MSKEEKDIAQFVAFCVEIYGKAKGMTGEQVVDLFSKYGVTDYLSNRHETIHMQCRQFLIATIDDFIEMEKIKKSKEKCPVNQDNLHLLLPGKISWLVEYMQDDYGLSLQECFNRIYHSQLYKKLAKESTKYWHFGSVDLYNELKKEI